jgi:hypothetical protein
MASAKTGTFYLTETVTLPANSADGTVVQGSIDLGAYVNVATGQAIAIESVDFVIQSGNNSPLLRSMVTADGALGFQLTDLNNGAGLVRADNHSLVSSGGLNIDTAGNQGFMTQDIYPDNFGGTSLSESFMVVNDMLYLVAGVYGADINTADVHVTARIRCKVAKLSSKDWMAIAIQSTAADN